MIPAQNIENELKALNSRLPYPGSPVFSVPEGYFDSFPLLVLNRVKQMADPAGEIESLSPLLASISRKMPMEVPAGYFGEGSVSETSPVLLAAGKSMPYSVPEHYFEDLPDAVHALVWKPKARVLSMPKRVMRMAAAAVVTGLIAISGWLYFNQSTAVPVEQSQKWVANKLDDVSNEALDDFINSTATTEVTEPVAAAENEEVREMLTDVSVNEIDNFLAQVPDEEDLTLVN